MSVFKDDPNPTVKKHQVVLEFVSTQHTANHVFMATSEVLHAIIKAAPSVEGSRWDATIDPDDYDQPAG